MWLLSLLLAYQGAISGDHSSRHKRSAAGSGAVKKRFHFRWNQPTPSAIPKNVTCFHDRAKRAGCRLVSGAEAAQEVGLKEQSGMFVANELCQNGDAFERFAVQKRGVSLRRSWEVSLSATAAARMQYQFACVSQHLHRSLRVRKAVERNSVAGTEERGEVREASPQISPASRPLK